MDSALIALIRLQPVSIQEIADHIGLAKPNLIAAMGGRRSIPEKARERLLDTIGADPAGALRTDKVHCWRARDTKELEEVLPRIQAPARAWQLKSPLALVEQNEIVVVLAGPTIKLQTSVISIVKLKRDLWESFRTRNQEVCDTTPIEIGDPASLWSPSLPRSAILFVLEQAMRATPTMEPSWEEIIALAGSKGIARRTVWEWINGMPRDRG